MPTKIRRMLSLAVVLVAIVAFYLEQRSGNDALKWYAIILGTAMVGAIWLFPEAKKHND